MRKNWTRRKTSARPLKFLLCAGFKVRELGSWLKSWELELA